MSALAGKRYLIYFLYHPRGLIDDYVPALLGELRAHFDVMHVVSNGPLASGAAARLPMVDLIQERANTGFDVGAYADAIASLPDGALRTLRELTLANYTFFPVAPFAPMFDWAAQQQVDFWGPSEHGALSPDPFTGTDRLEAHLNSHWITVRAPMLADPAFADWWRDLPPIDSYQASVRHHEARFTAHFNALGYRHAAMVTPDHTAYPAFVEAHHLVPAGFPLLKRRLFFHEPVAFGDAHGTNPRAAMASLPAKTRGQIWASIAGTADPWVIYQNADLLYIMPIGGGGCANPIPLHVEVTAPLSAADRCAFHAALRVPVTLSCSGPGAASLAPGTSIVPPPDGLCLIARLTPGRIDRFARCMAHLARCPALIDGAARLFIDNPGFGLALPPFQVEGSDSPEEQLDAGRPTLACHDAVALTRAALVPDLMPLLGDPLAPPRRAADLGYVTITVSNTEDFARHAIKLEARYRMLAGRLGGQGPHAPLARLDHLMHRAGGEAARTAQDQSFDAGFNTGFDAGFEQGFDSGFRDGWRKAQHAAPLRLLRRLTGRAR